MKVLREYAQFQLNKGYGMALGLYNLYNTQTKECSYWFDEETKDSFMKCSDSEFINRCKQAVGFSIAENKTNKYGTKIKPQYRNV